MTNFWSNIRSELGITALLSSPRDVYFLLLTRFIRMLAYGSSTLVLAVFFSHLGFSDLAIGIFMALTLAGDVVISLLLTFIADALGRRKILLLGALLMSASGIVFSTASNYYVLLLAAILGVISPSGNEIGPFRAVEESTLAYLSTPATRSDIFAWYVVVGNLGLGIGAFAGGWTTRVLKTNGWQDLSAYRVVFVGYAVIGLIKAMSTLLLSQRCEIERGSESADERSTVGAQEAPTGSTASRETEPLLASTVDETQQVHEEDEAGRHRQHNATVFKQASAENVSKKKTRSKFAQISASSRRTLFKLCGLFFFDSLGSGMMPNSLIVLYITRKFHADEGLLGTALGIAIFSSSIGNIFASSLAKRVGLIQAMVITHFPSAVLLAILPVMPTFGLTVACLIARAILASMDQAPRTAFLAAIVQPSERTAVMGIVNTIKTMSQSSGPFITGLLANQDFFWVAFVLAGTVKASYDIGMLVFFGRHPVRSA